VYRIPVSCPARKFWPSTATLKRYDPVRGLLGAMQMSVVEFTKMALVQPMPAPLQPNEHARVVTFTNPEPVTVTDVFPKVGPEDGLIPVSLDDTNVKPLAAFPDSVDCVVAIPVNETVTSAITESGTIDESRPARDGVEHVAKSEEARVAVVKRKVEDPVALAEVVILKMHVGRELRGYLDWLKKPVPRRVIIVFPVWGPAIGETEVTSTDCVNK